MPPWLQSKINLYLCCEQELIPNPCWKLSIFQSCLLFYWISQSEDVTLWSLLTLRWQWAKIVIEQYSWKSTRSRSTRMTLRWLYSTQKKPTGQSGLTMSQAQSIHFHREGPSYPMWPFVQHSTVSTSANKNNSVHKSVEHWAFNFWWPWAFTLRIAHCTLLFRAFLLWLVHIWLYQLTVHWAVHN